MPPPRPRELPPVEKPKQYHYSHVPPPIKVSIPATLPPATIGISNPYPPRLTCRSLWGDAGPRESERRRLEHEPDPDARSIVSCSTTTTETERKVYMRQKADFSEREHMTPTEVIKNLRTGQEYARSHARNPDLWHGKKHGPFTAFREEMRKQPAMDNLRTDAPCQ